MELLSCRPGILNLRCKDRQNNASVCSLKMLGLFIITPSTYGLCLFRSDARTTIIRPDSRLNGIGKVVRSVPGNPDHLYSCSGAVITLQIILAAGHCFDGDDAGGVIAGKPIDELQFG